MNELLTWATLGTMVGATAATLLIVQFIKPLSFMQKVDTRLMAFATALIILIAATLVAGGAAADYGLAVLNAFVVAAAAMGTYEVSFKITDAKKSD